jgi:Tfp pilus assembly protein PilX
MIFAMSVMVITMVLVAAVFAAVQADTPLTRADLDGKRAYSAAQAGVQQYLYQLNANSANSGWWETCTNDTLAKTAVPGSTTGTQYAYSPVPANGKTACSSTDPVGSLIDSTTGSLRMKFSGYSGQASRTIVASLRTLSPLSFLWYTVHETIDTALGNSGCATFYWQGSGPPSACYIYWVTGDVMNGPMYTQDQLLINPGDAPVFGRTAADQIISQAPKTSVCAFSLCQSSVFNGTATPNPSTQVPLPSDNSNLLPDATSHGKTYSGATSISIRSDGVTADVYNCPTSSSCATSTVDLTQYPIIYASNASGCNASYDPTNVSYPTTGSGHPYGACGDIYISGTYKTPLTLAAANDVIVTGNLQTTEDSSGNPTGSATLGLVANQYVRVKHDCSGNPAVTIDGAILTLQHSFFVDNYDCGGSHLGTLTVHGAIAQYYRGVVGQVGANGYLKNYNYDDRLALILPPYLFDLQNTQWGVVRETLCSPTTASTQSGSCSYTGT